MRTIGAGIGFIIGGAPGLAFAAVCLVAGLVMLSLSEARGTRTKTAAHKNEPVHETAHVLILLKEVHARPQRNGKFQEIGAGDESGFEFEIFLNCWLLNETDLPVQLVEPIQVTIAASDGSSKFGERVSSDLEKWRVGSVARDEWNPDKVRATQVKISELSITEPLECGVPRQGAAARNCTLDQVVTDLNDHMGHHIAQLNFFRIPISLSLFFSFGAQMPTNHHNSNQRLIPT